MGYYKQKNSWHLFKRNKKIIENDFSNNNFLQRTKNNWEYNQ